MTDMPHQTDTSLSIRSLWPTWLACFFFFSGMTSLWPALPFLVLRLGADPITIGFFVAALPATGWIFALVFGRLSDRHDRRTLFLIVQLCALLAHACYSFAGSLVVIFAIRMAHGVGGAIMGGFQTLISGYLGESGRAQGLAMLGIMFGCGLITGTATSATVLWHLDWSITDIPIMGASFMFVGWLINLFFMPHDRKAQKIKDKSSLNWPVLVPLFLVLLFLQVGFTGVEATFGLWLNDTYGRGAADLGFLLACAAAANIVGHGVTGAANRRLNARLLGLVGLALVFVGSLVLGWNPSYASVYIGMSILGLGMGVFLPAQQHLVAGHSGSALGIALGVNQSFHQVARILGPPAAGYLYQSFTPIAPFVVLAIIAPLVFVLAYKRW